MFIRNLDDQIVKNFKAACALDGLPIREVIQNLIKQYADDRLSNLEKGKDK